jgi:SMC interacting uncharacterized protein involved in chromosome segregation
MRAPVLLSLLVAVGCGETSTRPAECKAFVDAFNRAMPAVQAAGTEAAGADGDLAKLSAAMRKLATAYRALDQDLRGQTILDEQLRLRVEGYRGVLKKSTEAATLIGEATPETEVFLVNQAQMELQKQVSKERTAVEEINGYCTSGT